MSDSNGSEDVDVKRSSSSSKPRRKKKSNKTTMKDLTEKRDQLTDEKLSTPVLAGSERIEFKTKPQMDELLPDVSYAEEQARNKEANAPLGEQVRIAFFNYWPALVVLVIGAIVVMIGAFLFHAAEVANAQADFRGDVSRLATIFASLVEEILVLLAAAGAYTQVTGIAMTQDAFDQFNNHTFGNSPTAARITQSISFVERVPYAEVPRWEARIQAQDQSLENVTIFNIQGTSFSDFSLQHVISENAR